MNKTYNIIIDRIRAFAEGHELIAGFSHGQTDVKDLDKFPLYPHLHVVPESFSSSQGAKQYNIRFLLFDLPRSIEDKTDYQKEVISDLSQVLEDFVNEIIQGQTLFGDDADLIDIVRDFDITPFMEEHEQCVTGVDATFGIIVPYQYSACNIPASWINPSGGLNCPNVTVNVDGVFYESAPAGSTVNVICGGGPCEDATVENSDQTFQETIPAGDTLVLDDIEIEVYVGGNLEDTITIPAMVNTTLNINWTNANI